MRIGSHLSIAQHHFGELGESAKGKPYIEVPLQVEDGACKGERLTWRGYISEAAASFSVKALVQAFGWNGDPGNLTCGEGFDGRCMAVVEEETNDNGKTFLKCKYLNPIGFRASSERQAELADEVRDRCLQAAIEAGATATAMASDSRPGTTTYPARESYKHVDDSGMGDVPF